MYRQQTLFPLNLQSIRRKNNPTCYPQPQLYRHLRATLTAPVVLAHYNTGCAGRDNSWIRFDNRTPAGRRVRSVAPHYSGRGCCDAPPRRRRAASHEAVG